jgi:hypothetical protein
MHAFVLLVRYLRITWKSAGGKMRKTSRLRILISIILFVVLNLAVSANAMTSLQSAEGIIIVSGHSAMIDINGTSYIILKENNSYSQFKNRHIKMYNIRIDYINGESTIDFTGFRFIDALA